MKQLFTAFVALILSANLFAAKVDTVSIYSQSMKKNIKCVVVTPDKKQKQMPVIYHLHGHSGNYTNWVNSFHTKALVDQYGVMVVSPDGDFNSWWLDSPIDPTMRYETFVSSELIKYIDKHYPTVAHRSGRAITGLSMGGHGALYNAIRHQDVFGAAGSMSGGVDFRPFPHNWDIADLLGEKAEYPENWDQYTVMGQLHLLKPDALKLIIDCGTDDFFYAVNEALHQELLNRGIAHRYITDEGAHNMKYWIKGQYAHFLYFSQFFNQTK